MWDNVEQGSRLWDVWDNVEQRTRLWDNVWEIGPGRGTMCGKSDQVVGQCDNIISHGET